MYLLITVPSELVSNYTNLLLFELEQYNSTLFSIDLHNLTA